jgi:hypothetical protein
MSCLFGRVPAGVLQSVGKDGNELRVMRGLGGEICILLIGC